MAKGYEEEESNPPHHHPVSWMLLIRAEKEIQTLPAEEHRNPIKALEKSWVLWSYTLFRKSRLLKISKEIQWMLLPMLLHFLHDLHLEMLKSVQLLLFSRFPNLPDPEPLTTSLPPTPGRTIHWVWMIRRANNVNHHFRKKYISTSRIISRPPLLKENKVCSC